MQVWPPCAETEKGPWWPQCPGIEHSGVEPKTPKQPLALPHPPPAALKTKGDPTQPGPSGGHIGSPSGPSPQVVVGREGAHVVAGPQGGAWCRVFRKLARPSGSSGTGRDRGRESEIAFDFLRQPGAHIPWWSQRSPAPNQPRSQEIQTHPAPGEGSRRLQWPPAWNPQRRGESGHRVFAAVGGKGRSPE